MPTALLYGSLASSSFVIGVVLGLFTSPPRRLVAAVIGFGAGVLVSALTFDLMREAFDTGGATYAVGGFLLGAAIYVVADVGLERMAAKSPKRTGRDATDVVPDADRKRESPEVAAVAGTALLVGAVLDGIPESIAIGVSLEAEGPALVLCCLPPSSLAMFPKALAALCLCGKKVVPTATSSEPGSSSRWSASSPRSPGTHCCPGSRRGRPVESSPW